MKTKYVSAAVLGLFIVGVLTCSSSDTGSNDNGTGGNQSLGTGGTGGLPSLGTDTAGTSGTLGTSTSTFDGGTLLITEEEQQIISDADNCAGWASEIESAPAKLELVVDISGSMDDTATGTTLSKWDVTRDSLIKAIPGDGTAAYPGLGSNMSVGLLYYPNMIANVSTTVQDITQCIDTEAEIPMAILGGEEVGSHRLLLRDSIGTAILGRGTPTYDAYQYAFSGILSPDVQAVSGDPYMLLITDGMPTIAQGCTNPAGNLTEVDPQPIVDLITTANTEYGIKTFVIGSPGSETAKGWLSEAAYSGGTGAEGCSVIGPDGSYCHMDLTLADDFSIALSDSLSSITSAIDSCEYDLPIPPTDKTLDVDTISVIIEFSTGTELVVRDDLGDCTEGWQLGETIVLCDSTCARVKTDGTASVNVVAGCESLTSTIIQ